MRERLHRFRQHLMLRPCRGNCGSDDVHTHHLTWYGMWHYVWRYQLRED